MSKAQKAANSGAKIRNYPQEVGVEPRGNAGELSNALAYTEGKDRATVNTSRLLEQVLDRNNLNQAYKRVKKNRGKHGVDRMSVEELLPYLQRHGEAQRKSIKVGSYRPHSVRRVEIPKPDGAGVRLEVGLITLKSRIYEAIAKG